MKIIHRQSDRVRFNESRQTETRNIFNIASLVLVRSARETRIPGEYLWQMPPQMTALQFNSLRYRYSPDLLSQVEINALWEVVFNGCLCGTCRYENHLVGLSLLPYFKYPSWNEVDE